MIRNANAYFALSAALLVGFGLTACGSSSDGGSNAPAVTDFLIQDGPADELSSFSATVSALRLVDGMGMPSANLLPASVDVEFLGLQTSSAWLASIAPPIGNWSGLEVDFVGASLVAKAQDGTPVAVTASSTTLTADFPSNLATGAKGYDRVVIDLDLDDSLSGDISSPPLDFDPSGSATNSNGSADTAIDEIKGVVTTTQPSNSRFTMSAFVDDDLNLELGEVWVRVSNSTLLIMENGAVFASRSDFFAALTADQTLVEVHGTLGSGGQIQATRIEIEDQTAGVGSAGVVEIEGLILDLDPMTSSFELLIQEVEKGASVANPVLSTLGDPVSIEVSYSLSTLFLQDDSNQLLDFTALSVGQEVDVRFPTFMTEPFEAGQIEFEDTGAEYEAFVESTTGLPTSIVVRLKANDPALLAGLVQDTDTDVSVDVLNTSYSLDVENDPTLLATQLQPGMRLDISGQLSGTPAVPVIAANRIEVQPGEFEGSVMSTNAGLNFFQAGVSSIDDPFGDNVTTGPLDVFIHPSAVFEGDATTQAAFFALFDGLQTGEFLAVEVEGIDTGNANEVMAYEIEVELQIL